MEHTKGPWSWDREEDDVWKITSDSGTITSIVQYPDKECNPDRECEANARLIAAAPDLYSALIALRSFMWDEGYADQNIPMAQADAAIAKAEASSE